MLAPQSIENTSEGATAAKWQLKSHNLFASVSFVTDVWVLQDSKMLQLCSDLIAISTPDKQIAKLLCTFVMGKPGDAVGCGYQAASTAVGSTPNGPSTHNPE